MLKKSILYIALLANAAVVSVIWWRSAAYLLQSNAAGGGFIAFGRLAGLLGAFFILIQLALIGRIAWIEQTFGFDALNRLHRWIGYGIAVFFIGHPFLLSLGYARLNQPTIIGQFLDFIKNWDDVFKALIGLAVFAFVIAVSLPIIRRKLKYETWYFTHLLMYVGIAFVFGHQTANGDLAAGWPLIYWYVLNFGVVGLLVLYRFLRPLFLFYRHRFFVEEVRRESDDVYSIYIGGRAMDKFHFRAGQFANLNFLATGLWPTHPFSFSAAPNGENLRFAVKQGGDFTSKIGTIKPGAKVIIDGPLGAFTEERARQNKYLFIAGGIGITPIRAMIESLFAKKADMALLYATKTDRDLVFKNELEKMIAKRHYVISRDAGDLADAEMGRIDKEKIARLVPDFAEREVYLCGPKEMMKAVSQNLSELGLSQRQIHQEKFAH